MEENKAGTQISKRVRGVPFPNVAFYEPKTIEEAMDYRPLDGDTLVVSFPKTGTTLTLYTVVQILTKGKSFPGLQELYHEKAPFMELSMEPFRNLEPPRVYMTHIPYDLQARNENAKYIYVYRNPADTIVSTFHFYKGMTYPNVFDEFFELFMKSETPYGNYFDHVLAYYRHRNEPNILFVSYEKFLANKEEEILRIAKFLGDEYFLSLKNNSDLVRKILENTNFDHMKKNLRMSKPDGERDVEIKMFRKGIVGDGKNTLSATQMQRLKELTMQKMQGTTILDEWLSLL